MKNRQRLFGTILAYELKKIIVNRFTIIAIILLTGYSLMQGVFQTRNADDNNSEITELRKAIDGREIDDELLSEMVADSDEYGVFWDETNVTYEELASWIEEATGNNGHPLSSYKAKDIYKARQDIIDEAMILEQLTKEEKDYWKSSKQNAKEPFIWYEAGETLGIIEIAENTPLIMLLMLTLFLSNSFAGEYKSRTYPLLRCTRGGYSLTYWAKIIAAVIWAVILTVYESVLAIGTSLILWGSGGWNAAVQIISPFAVADMTIGELIIRILITGLVVSVFLAVIICLLSECIKNPTVVMAAMIAGFMAVYACAREIPYSLRAISQAIYLLSPLDMTSSSMLYDYRLIGANKHYLSMWQLAPILYLLLSVMIIALGKPVYERLTKE